MWSQGHRAWGKLTRAAGAGSEYSGPVLTPDPPPRAPEPRTLCLVAPEEAPAHFGAWALGFSH